MTDRQHDKPLIGLIPAAGKGVRARPHTYEIHKGMLEINGKPNIERTIELMRDELQIRDIVIVVGHLGESIREYFQDGSRWQVNINYVENTTLDRGWAWSVNLAAPHIDDFFCIVLCDEYYANTNHRALLQTGFRDQLATCAAIHVDTPELIKQNYALEVISRTGGHTIEKLLEKPETVHNDLMGTGTFVCSPAVFALLEEAFRNTRSLNFVNFLNEQIRNKYPVALFELQGTYVNINDPDSLRLAKDLDSAARVDR